MPGSFPALHTKALAQYPLERAASFAVEVLEFLDFSRQAYRDLASTKNRWVVALEKLDESEIARLKEFFELQRGRWGTFNFTDPWNGVVHPRCSFAEDSFQEHQSEEGRHQTRLTIYEHV
jgi:hypothetical protein